MTTAVTFDGWLLGLHLLSAFALAGSIVVFWYLIVASRSVDTPGLTVAMGPVAGVTTKIVRAGAAGTLVFGVWLAIRLDGIQVWDGWVLAAIVLLVITAIAGSRSGAEYERAMRKAGELEAAGQTGPNAELLALNRTARGLWLHAIATLSVLLMLIDMIWKPGASDLPPLSDWNFPLLVHIVGAVILVGGMIAAAIAFLAARGDERKLRLGFYSLLFVALPGLIISKFGATWIWSKFSGKSFISSAFPSRDDPHWIMIGGTALDGGGALLVLALILGWFGLKRLDGTRDDFLAKVPVVRNMEGATLLKGSTIISVVLLVGYVLAIWAMGARPS
jgi:hypothetical protein